MKYLSNDGDDEKFYTGSLEDEIDKVEVQLLAKQLLLSTVNLGDSFSSRTFRVLFGRRREIET